MEAAASLGLAANVLQLVELGAKLLSTGNEIYQAGSTVENAELEIITKDLTALNERLKSSFRPHPSIHGPLNQDDQNLENLALESEKIAQELISLLSSLHTEGDVSKYKSLVLAVKSAWKKQKMEDTKGRLQNIRAQMQLRMLVSIREEGLQKLDYTSRNIVESVCKSNSELTSALASQSAAIAMQQKASNAMASERHDQIVKMMRNHGTITNSVNVLERIKAGLCFERQDDRFEDISEAHSKTFEWALQEDRSQQSWPSLRKWLLEEQGVYWISGKAGSGKSTLMKFLRQDSRTLSALESWAEPSELLIVDFYFWNPGSDLQKSQEGLFRSLLWQTLHQEPSLSLGLFPEQYEFGARWAEFPTFHQLRRAFGRLTNLVNNDLKMIFFVDGLDEFESTRATVTELAELFLGATKSSNIKALVSSRPLSPFEDSFSETPKLRLQQLTHNDMITYVNGKLRGHPRFQQLSEENPTDTEALIIEITDKASGVFLWVNLVVKALLEGFQNYDLLEDLYRRLRELPSDLEDLFRHMLRHIPPEYQYQSSRIFQIFRCVENSYIHTEFGHVTLVPTPVLFFYAEMELNACIQLGITSDSPQEKKRISQEIEGRLRSRCAGLLELSVSEHHTITYLHKTVAEFIERDEVWAGIVAGGKEFDPHTALLQASIMSMKRDTNRIQDSAWFLSVMHHAYAVETSGMNLQTLHELWNELGRVLSLLCLAPTFLHSTLDVSRARNTWEQFGINMRTREPTFHNFLSFTVETGLTSYIEDHIKTFGKSCIVKNGMPLLQYASTPSATFNYTVAKVNPKMAGILLKNGADPNQEFNGFTAWTRALHILPVNKYDWIALLKYLLSYGADADTYIEKNSRRDSSLRAVKLNLLYIFVDQSEYARNILSTPSRDTESGASSKMTLSLKQYREMTPSQSRELKNQAVDLVRFMLNKGAKDESWVLLDNEWIKDPLLDSDDDPWTEALAQRGLDDPSVTINSTAPSQIAENKGRLRDRIRKRTREIFK
ncbi:hypothetical protein BS50DRAFT_520818 [Corynespora cassiicola Philippines]|uniref:Uncharacterized protein n=1 Tax=Corynespora cassiicola Philippines TaxID=1448308 RepID=A0A2T2NTI0_CORCC|nr:hypothetical protein BS50DRAFT_520818 [Corynespora cassiicola Philippines]